nr:M23 family metallopeptidase [candidate division KSB1 bacterium]NIR72746.1 M23 family metallopeptidase [candidate division KSB1 bacterium]NIS26834.1 M23 family metallopeptidase [candidate division KSB1 bacterium]NIT73628.1 M23 family metallopeptidase [candidate division KSB1 bacterium]NIU27501.1 M23 family metallopeptidase [candidate division KSB1 bacterium]
LGAIFYWKYSDLLSVNDQLISYNSQLQQDNKRVISLADKLYALEQEYSKVRTLLGVKKNSEAETNGALKPSDPMELVDKIIPAVSSNTSSGGNDFAPDKRYLLAPKKSKIHDYAEHLPTLLPVKGFLTLDFKKDGWFVPKTHTGIDIVAKKGTLVRSAGAGVVIFSSWTLDLGYLIIIDHGDGFLSYYAHNQRLLKPEGGHVKKGEPIALLGTSGKSSGPHLHFEIWKDGMPVDPKEYILAFHERFGN